MYSQDDYQTIFPFGLQNQMSDTPTCITITLTILTGILYSNVHVLHEIVKRYLKELIAFLLFFLM